MAQGHRNSLDGPVSHQPSPFASLTSLKVFPLKSRKIYPFYGLDSCLLKSFEINPIQLDEEQASKEINLSTEVINYLLDGSPKATFTVVSHEKARAINVTKGIYRLMSRLQEYLQKIEGWFETRMADVERKKTLADSCGVDFEARIYGCGDTEKIFCTLQNVKELLNKVLASKRVEMQACFHRLVAQAETVVNKIMDDVMNQCHVKRSNFSGYLNEFSEGSLSPDDMWNQDNQTS